MSRIFNELGSSYNAFDYLTQLKTNTEEPWLSQGDFKCLEDMFSFRHGLVHEINRSTVGHFNIRDNWDPDEAIRHGSLALSLVRGIETTLFHVAKLFRT